MKIINYGKYKKDTEKEINKFSLSHWYNGLTVARELIDWSYTYWPLYRPLYSPERNTSISWLPTNKNQEECCNQEGPSILQNLQRNNVKSISLSLSLSLYLSIYLSSVITFSTDFIWIDQDITNLWTHLQR